MANSTGSKTTIPESIDWGLLILRLGAGACLFIKHGIEKLTGYSRMVQHFPDPIHLGPHVSLAFALITDGICSLLVVFGLFTRIASSLILFTLVTAFFFVHHAAFLSDQHVELVALYIVVYASLAVSGAGRFSLDEKIRK
jgi:putative oxidoreductase